MTFGEAIERMDNGAFVAREGWNGKKQFIYKTEGSIPAVQDLRGRARAAANYAKKMEPLLEEGTTGAESVVILPHIDMMTEQGAICCGWLASQTDIVATDWYVRDYSQNHQEPDHDKD